LPSLKAFHTKGSLKNIPIKSPLTPLYKEGDMIFPFEKGGFRGGFERNLVSTGKS
jgi:hypothetical protein